MNHLPNMDVQGFFLAVSFRHGFNIPQKVVVYCWDPPNLGLQERKKMWGHSSLIIPKSYEMFG